MPFKLADDYATALHSKMDKFIDARFDRVEKALAVLIDSIANYNPSPTLAEDLLTADRELSGGLQTRE